MKVLNIFFLFLLIIVLLVSSSLFFSGEKQIVVVSSSNNNENKVIQESHSPVQDSIQSNIVEEIVPIKKDCNFNLSEDAIIFYHSSDIHSYNMKPIVEKLEKDYPVFWQSDLWDEDFNNCFGFSGNVPAFVCSSSSKMITGEISFEELENFASNCKI